MIRAVQAAGLLAVGMACAWVTPHSVTAEAAAGHACYGSECGPNGEVRVSATWDTLPNTRTSEVKPLDRARMLNEPWCPLLRCDADRCECLGMDGGVTP